MVNADTEKIILASWLMGENLEDLRIFNVNAFDANKEIARCFFKGIRDPIEIAKAANVSPQVISEIITSYSPNLYASAVASVKNELAHEWLKTHGNESPESIATAMQMFTVRSTKLPKPAENPVGDLIADFENRRKIPFVPTGISKLDMMLNGIRRKELTAIGARPSVGKSAFVQQVAMEVARHGQKVLFFPLEMSTIAVTERMFMRYTDVPQREVRKGLTEATWQSRKTADAIEIMNDLFSKGNLLIFERCNDLQVIRKLVAKHKPFMIVIDQLEQLKDGKREWNDKRSRFSHMTNELQGMAMDMDIAIWLACQINRSAENTKPTMANLKESGSIEEDSDNVILLHREEEEKTETQRILLDLAKQRNGECGLVPLVFMASKYAFYGVEK